jgi:hypothetical protein
MGSQEAFESAQTFRLDVPLHTLLTQPRLRSQACARLVSRRRFRIRSSRNTLGYWERLIPRKIGGRILGWSYNNQRVIKTSSDNSLTDSRG